MKCVQAKVFLLLLAIALLSCSGGPPGPIGGGTGIPVQVPGSTTGTGLPFVTGSATGSTTGSTATGTTTGSTTGTTGGTTGGGTNGSTTAGQNTGDPTDFPPVPPPTPDDDPPPPQTGGTVGQPPQPTPPAPNPGTVVGPPPQVTCNPPAPPPTPPPSGSGFKAPVGIPNPPFGVFETAPARPASWASSPAQEVPLFFYVNGSVTCSDTPSSRTGSPALPRCTIPIQLAAGSYVEVHGTYNTSHNAPRQIRVDGTAAAPVWIRGQDNTANLPTLTRGFQVYGKYTIIENLAFDLSAQTTLGNGVPMGLPGGKGSDPDPGAGNCGATYGNRNCNDHIAFRHIDVVGNTDQTKIAANNPCVSFNLGAPLGVFTANAAHDNIVILDFKFRKLRREPFDPDKDIACTAFAIGAPATNIWIMDSVCDEPVQGCVQIVATSDNRPMELINHIYIGRNTSYHAVKAAFTAKASSHVIFSQNTASSTRETTVASGNPSPAKCFNFQYGPHDVWFLFNTCYTNSVGFYGASNVAGQPGSNTNLFWIGNQVWDIKNGGEVFPNGVYYIPYFPQGADSSAAFTIRSGFNRWFINNTVWKSDACFYLARNDSPNSTANIINNICGGTDPIVTPNPYAIFVEDDATFGNSTIDNNLFCPSPATCSMTSADTLSGYRHGGTVEPTLQALINNTTQCDNCKAQPPFFVDAVNFDFHLTANSPQKLGKPVAQLPPFDLFKQNYGIDIAVDHDGNPLPATGPIDVGAFQFGGSPGSGSPSVCIP